MHCHRCKATTELYIRTRYKLKDGTDRKYYICRTCSTERCRKARQTPLGRASQSRAVKKYNSKNLIRTKAWIAARCIELRPCGTCGATPSHKHHPDPSKPLDVEFLCPSHHKKVHLRRIK